MGRRRHFVAAGLGSALLCLVLWRLWRLPVNLEEQQARALVRIWLAADYRDGGGDPALQSPQSGPPQARPDEVAQINIARCDIVHPFIRPPQAQFAALVRVELRPGGPVLSESETTRHFLLIQPPEATWKVQSEITESAFRWRIGS